MIQNKQDLREYIMADEVANHFIGYGKYLNIVRKYLIALRKYEYRLNVGGGILKTISKVHLYRLSVKTGITIGPNCFGKGLYIPHYGCITVNGSARFGDNCVIQNGVNISEGAAGGVHIYFGAGCKIMRNVFIPNDTIVGANAVVTHSFEQQNIVLAGIPAKVISERGYKERTYV